MIIKKYYEKNFSEVLNKIKENIEKEGFKITAVHEVSKTLRKNNKEIGFEAIILEFCNPEMAFKALSINKEVINFMPCKIAIYEDEGKLITSIFFPKEIISNFGESIKELAEEMEKILKRIIEI